MKRLVDANTVVWLAGTGLFLSTFDTGIINVALPALQSAWHASASATAWAVTAYAISLTGTLLLWGRLGDRLGPWPVFSVGLVIFGGGSVLCGMAPSLHALVAFRALQGGGGAMVQATAAALVATGTPRDRQPVALGTLSLFQGLGPVIGPSVAGVLLTWMSWRWLFWINLPIVAALVWIVIACRPKRSKARCAPPSVDWAGHGLFFATVLYGLLTISMSPPVPWWTWGVSAVLVGSVWISRERRRTDTLFPRVLWPVKTFWAAFGAVAAVGGATALGFMIPPYILTHFQHLTPWQIGLLNMAAPLGMVLFSRPSSRWIGRIPATSLMGVGLAVMATALTGLAGTPPTAPPLFMAPFLVLYGVGAALFFPRKSVV